MIVAGCRAVMPKGLTAAQIATLQKLSADRPEDDAKVKVGIGMTFCRTFSMRVNDVALV